jgi:hypothetical protein
MTYPNSRGGSMTLSRQKLGDALERGCHHEMARAKGYRLLKKPF